ncbi:MAG: ribonuclease J [Oscillospiraceae bacterium]|nr:ribonuclease J [Oscillospiraceae bacterium]
MAENKNKKAEKRSLGAKQTNKNKKRTENAAQKSQKTKKSQNHNRKTNQKQIAKMNNDKKQKPKKQIPEKSVKIAFLGGLNEVGKNMTLYESEGDMILVDCGLAFPEPEMLGVDLVIPDFAYVEKNKDKIKGIFITHGHEDHIGGLPFLLMNYNIPVYGTKLTIGLIKSKLEEHKILDKVKLHEIKPKGKVSLGAFEVEAIHVNHSIPDALALAISTPAGVILQTGDFKIDTTPIDGEVIDLARIARLGEKGILCLLSDSTNAERPGFTPSERTVGESFERLFPKADGKRLIVATFASNIHRVQQIIDAAETVGRKVALSGRSLENVVATASELGYLRVPEGILIGIDQISRYPHDKLVIITTGSQGEPMSALYRMAFSEHRRVEIGSGDCVIISATPIPGNEKTVGKVVDELLKRGAEVVYERMYDVHVSGHACQEELKLMLSITKPKFFIPVHGEQKHLQKHAYLAESVGINPKNIFIADNGKQVELTKRQMTAVADVPAGQVFVDGYGVGDVGNAVIRERKRLAEDGLMIISAVIEKETGKLVSGPDVISRGFVFVRDSEKLISEAKLVAQIVIDECIHDGYVDWSVIRNRMRDDVSRLLYDRTKRSPMVLPIITSV